MGRVLFINGHVWHSLRQRVPPSSWLLISRPDDARCTTGKVLAQGSGDAPEHSREKSEVIDLAGAIVLPGLQDAHIHIGCMGESARYVELSDCRSVAEVQEAVRKHAEDNQDLPWVIGTGWDQNLWSPPTCLNRADLDAALPDGRPCLLYRRCWHAIVVNSAAMSAAGIEAESVWPPAPANDAGDSGRTGQVGEREGKGSGGRVDVQGVEVDESQRPSGLFREESMQLVESAVTAPSFDIRCDQYAEALDRCVRSGLTAVHSNDDNAVEIYARLQEEGRLPVRVYLTLPHDEIVASSVGEQMATGRADTSTAARVVDGLAQAQEGLGKVTATPATTANPPVGHSATAGAVDGGSSKGKEDAGRNSATMMPWSGGEGLVSWHRVKLFSDGSLGAETAAMRVPYVNTTNRGMLIHEPETLTRKVAEARDRGFRVEIHAIGDRALANVLDAFEGAGITAADRPIVTHCQVAGPDLVARMKKLGAVAAVQPSFVPSDAAVVLKRLSPSVHASCYPWRTLLHGEVTCAGSSDAPIETHDPLRGIYDAVFRPNRHPSATPGEGPQIISPASIAEDSTKSAARALAKDDQGAAVAVAATAIHSNEAAIPPVSALPAPQAQVDRTRGDQEPANDCEGRVDPFLPDERLTLEEAVWMYTAGGAIAAGMEDRVGVIRPGFLADLTILEVEGGAQALLDKPSLIVEAKVSQVWVGGSRRWNAVVDDSAAAERDQDMVTLQQSLGSSGLPGKNGPKRKRPTERSNPWLSGGPGRMGRCRCCS